MAIYHMSTRNVSKSKGQSVKTKAQYVQREAKFEKEPDKLLYKESGNLPLWTHNNPNEYWAAADQFERNNGRLAKEVELALPRELSKDQNIILVKDMATYLSKEGQSYTFGIHEGNAHGVNNPHAHILVSTRASDGIDRSKEQFFSRANSKHPELGGAPRVNEMRDQKWLENAREVWAEKTNLALEKAGFEQRIDHRSYEAQGLTKVPQIHLGANTLAMEEKGIRTERGDMYQAIEAKNKELSQTQLEPMTPSQHAETFETQLDTELERYTSGDTNAFETIPIQEEGFELKVLAEQMELKAQKEAEAKSLSKADSGSSNELNKDPHKDTEPQPDFDRDKELEYDLELDF